MCFIKKFTSILNFKPKIMSKRKILNILNNSLTSINKLH